MASTKIKQTFCLKHFVLLNKATYIYDTKCINMYSVAQILSSKGIASCDAPSHQDLFFLHMANPIRRNLVKTIGINELSAKQLRNIYGGSWGAAQNDLRALIEVDIIQTNILNGQSYFRVNLKKVNSHFLRQLIFTNNKGI